jgi:hypothetical protein
MGCSDGTRPGARSRRGNEASFDAIFCEYPVVNRTSGCDGFAREKVRWVRTGEGAKEKRMRAQNCTSCAAASNHSFKVPRGKKTDGSTEDTRDSKETQVRTNGSIDRLRITTVGDWSE